MVRRFARDESGMTMGLVVIMIVLIGVMGAGLLTFVQRDLQSVIEVNRGQKSIEITDAGIQAAKKELLSNSFPHQYNDPTSSPFPIPDSSSNNSEWAFNQGAATCGTTPSSLPSGPGKCITTTSEGNVRVTIRYLPPPLTAVDRTNPNFAPENPPYSDDRDYFRVEADGVFNGARRKVQAIMMTEDVGIAKAYFATKNINLQDSGMSISNISLFAGGNITGLRTGMLQGTDSAYGNWQNSYNNKARLGSTAVLSGNAQATGAAAEGTTTYDPTPVNNAQRNAPAANSDRYKRIDFDNGSGSATPTPNYKFCVEGTVSCWPTGFTQPNNVITYPFKRGKKLDPEFLTAIAREQIRPGIGAPETRDNYVEQSGGNVPIDPSTFYQVNPGLSSVYVVRFTSPGTATIQSSGGGGTCPIQGTILVINGSVQTSSGGGSTKCFDGIISVQDPNNLGTLEYSNGDSFALNGFVSIEGTANLKGSVSPFVSNDVLNMPGYHNVKIWSWRECYNTTCS